MRRQLTLLVAAIGALIVIAFSIPLGLLVRQLAFDRALTGAERDAQLIAVFATATGGEPGAIDAIVGDGTINGNDLTVVLADGTALGAPLAPREDLGPVIRGTAGRRALPGGQAVYAPAIDSDGNRTAVRVFVDTAVLREGVPRAWLILAGLGALLIGLAVVLTDRLARSIVQPVERLSAAAARLGAGDRSVRVEPEGPPEIVEVAGEFNRLAEQVAGLLESERETAADLSHRLRTPLAALQLDAERLAEGDGREQILDDVAEMQRVVDFVIQGVRRPEDRRGEDTADLAEVVGQRTAFWKALADEQGRRATVHVGERPLPVAVPERDLEAAVDAVIGNVFSHTPEGTPYAVACGRVGGVVTLSVDDGGPGWDGVVIERGRSGGGSTGLGLDIARRTAEAAGGSLARERSPLGGARVVIRFDAAAAAGDG